MSKGRARKGQRKSRAPRSPSKQWDNPAVAEAIRQGMRDGLAKAGPYRCPDRYCYNTQPHDRTEDCLITPGVPIAEAPVDPPPMPVGPSGLVPAEAVLKGPPTAGPYPVTTAEVRARDGAVVATFEIPDDDPVLDVIRPTARYTVHEPEPAEPAPGSYAAMQQAMSGIEITEVHSAVARPIGPAGPPGDKGDDWNAGDSLLGPQEDSLPPLLPTRLMRWLDRATSGPLGDITNALVEQGWTIAPAGADPATDTGTTYPRAFPPGVWPMCGWPHVALPDTLESPRQVANLVVALKRAGAFEWEGR